MRLFFRACKEIKIIFPDPLLIHRSPTSGDKAIIGLQSHSFTRMWANAQRDGRPAERRWRLLFNAAKFG